MSSLEKKVQRYIQELDQRDAEEAAKIKDAQPRRAEEDTDELLLQGKALRLGVEVVRLLKNHEVTQLPIWKGVVIESPHPNHPNQTYRHTEYVQSGLGNIIYVTTRSGTDQVGESFSITDSRAIDSNGQIYDSWRKDTLLHGGIHLLNLPQTGITEPTPIGAEEAISTIKSEPFQPGIASLISGRGFYQK